MAALLIKILLCLLAFMVLLFVAVAAIVAYEYGLLDKALGIVTRRYGKGGRHVQI